MPPTGFCFTGPAASVEDVSETVPFEDVSADVMDDMDDNNAPTSEGEEEDQDPIPADDTVVTHSPFSKIARSESPSDALANSMRTVTRTDDEDEALITLTPSLSEGNALQTRSTFLARRTILCKQTGVSNLVTNSEHINQEAVNNFVDLTSTIQVWRNMQSNSPETSITRLPGTENHEPGGLAD